MKNNDLLAHLKSRRAESLASLVAEELERMIIRGELQVGDRINESALAQMFSISRGPIREACRSLEKKQFGQGCHQSRCVRAGNECGSSSRDL